MPVFSKTFAIDTAIEVLEKRAGEAKTEKLRTEHRVPEPHYLRNINATQRNRLDEGHFWRLRLSHVPMGMIHMMAY